MPFRGNLYIISAASGTGKTSLTRALVGSLGNISMSISHTTRSIRIGEQADTSYFFVDKYMFEKMIAEGAFLEYAKVFGNYYGTSSFYVEKQLEAGNDVLLDIDWQGAKQIREKMPQSISIFLLPPSKKTLRQRLESRKQDTDEIVEYRLRMANSEISHYNEFDYIVINDQFGTALQDLQAIIHTRRLIKSYQNLKHAKLIQELLQNGGE